jgi:hypothetical protein
MPTKQLPIMGHMGSKYGMLGVNEADPYDTSFYLNGYFETNPQAPEESRKTSFNKRPGTTLATDNGLAGLTGLPNNYKVQGMASTFDKNSLFFYVNNGAANRVYYYFPATGVLTNLGAAPAAAGNWTFTGPTVWTTLDGVSYGAPAGNPSVFAVTDFTKAMVISITGIMTEITDADFTALGKVTNFVAMDGYLFIGTSNNRIYNCDLNTPTSWAATSFLTVADTPGSIVWLGRARNYVVVFKQYSIEFYEDTGNPTPGSPLTAQKQLNHKIGCASKSSIKEVEDGYIFIGIDERGQMRVYKLSKADLSVKVISDTFMNQTLGGFTAVDGAYSVDPKVTGSNANAGESQVLYIRGKEFYALYLKEAIATSTSYSRTWLWDNELNVWCGRWATCVVAGNVLDDNFTPTQSVLLKKDNVLHNVLAQNFLSDASNPPYFISMTSWDATFGDSTGTGTRSYPLEWVSDVYDFGTRKRKFIDSVEIMYDVSSGGGTSVDQQVTLSYRDYDYNDVGSNKTVSVTKTYQRNGRDRLIWRRLGSTRRRAFAIKQQDVIIGQWAFRVWGIEIQYNLGEQDQEG